MNSGAGMHEPRDPVEKVGYAEQAAPPDGRKSAAFVGERIGNRKRLDGLGR